MLDQRSGLLEIDVDAALDGFALVIIPLVKFRAVNIADTRLLWRLEIGGIDAPFRAAGPAAAKALDQLFLIHLDVGDPVHCAAESLQHLFQGLRLGWSAWIPIQHRTLG